MYECSWIASWTLPSAGNSARFGRISPPASMSPWPTMLRATTTRGAVSALGHGAVRAAEDVGEAGRRVEGRRHGQGVEADRREQLLVDRVLGQRLVGVEAAPLVAVLAALGRHGVARPAGQRVDVAAVAEDRLDVGEVLEAVEVGDREAVAVPAELEARAVLEPAGVLPRVGREDGAGEADAEVAVGDQALGKLADRRGARRARRRRPDRSAGTGRRSWPARGARR